MGKGTALEFLDMRFYDKVQGELIRFLSFYDDLIRLCQEVPKFGIG